MKNCDVYLIVCQGQGDIDVGLVNEETWNWILSDYNSNSGSYSEIVPQTIVDTYPKGQTKVTITRGSYENDRALQCPKLGFDSVKSAMNYVKQNNCNLVDEFHGYIY